MIVDCLFEQCTESIDVGSYTQIENCQFVDCYESVITSDHAYNGGCSMKYCEFLNLKKKEVRGYILGALENVGACIDFTRTKGSNAYSNNIKKCRFSGVNIEKGYLIASHCLEKPDGDIIVIEDCDFENIRTNRKDGKVIKEFDEYYGMFKKKKEFKANYISNCRGLSQVNRSSSNPFNVEKNIKRTNSKGNPIGAILENAKLLAEASVINAQMLTVLIFGK